MEDCYERTVRRVSLLASGLSEFTCAWAPAPKLVSLTMYTDSAVQTCQTYFYVAASVDSNNFERTFSNEASPAIPTP